MSGLRQVRFAGIGGQGLVTLGAVLAEAAAAQGMEVAASQSYGSQARGGATHADVVISNETIDFPHVTRPDWLVVMAVEAWRQYVPGLGQRCTVLYDDFFVKSPGDAPCSKIAVPATGLAVDELGSQIAANFVMLGALVGLSKIVEPESVSGAIERIVGRRFVELNRRAFALGLELGRAEAGNAGAERQG